MRKIFIITILFVITLFGANILVKNLLLDKPEASSSQKTIANVEESVLEENQNKEEELAEEAEKVEINSKDIKNKISILRGRYAIKGLIQKGDTYLENKQLLLALQTYLQAIKQNPDDTKLLEKIGDTYFEMNKYKSAYNQYSKLVGNKQLDTNRITLSYIYSLNLTGEEVVDFKEINSKIESFLLTPEDQFFYSTSLECLTDMEGCQKKFQDYIAGGNGKVNQKLITIKEAFQNYEILQIKSKYFKDTQVLGALFEHHLYPISNIIGKKIIGEKSGYLPVLKIIAKGYFEMGDYENAKKYLLEYNKTDSKDPKVNYMLGIVNIKLHEYILSNIYFLKALKGGFEPQTTISRRLIYNYYLVENTEKMLGEFANLLNNGKDANEIDYNLGIYYSLIYGKELQANKWLNKALKLYPKNDNFYGFKGWIAKERGDLASAEEYLTKGYKLNSHNPLINLNLGIVEAEKGNLLKAKIYLKNTIGEDPKGDFGEMASKKLAQMKLEQKQLQLEIEENLDHYNEE